MPRSHDAWSDGDPWSDEYERDVDRANRLFRGVTRSFVVVLVGVFVTAVAVPAVAALRFTMEVNEQECQVTASGIEHRRLHGFEIDQGDPDEVEVGDRYTSGSGCVPCDSFVEYHYRWFVIQRSAVVPDDACGLDR